MLKKLFFFIAMTVLSVAVVNAQSISGKVVTNNNEPVAGATVNVDGSTISTTTDADGSFSIDAQKTSGKITITHINYISQTVRFTSTDLGVITLEANDQNMEEVVVVGRGVIDLAKDRNTPIAVSTIGKTEILDKGVGNVEFPEIMKNTPSIYVTNQAGGFGDGQMFTRGFDQSNTAFLLNGQPINGMEDGNMYWSNWQGITDIANAIQVQRGLGSSKLAISSVGGTINIVTKATELRKGGMVRLFTGNDGYAKATVGYNTGLNNKWGFSFMLDYWRADKKYAIGTAGQGQSYFFSVGYKPNDNHNLNFMIFGSPQWHDQNYSKPMITSYNRNTAGEIISINTPGYDITGIKGNSNYGYYNGEGLTIRKNYYHKPVANLNWDWTLNEKASLSTVVYASIGRGGGTGTLGRGAFHSGLAPFGGGFTSTGLVNWDAIADYNETISSGISSGSAGTVLRASANNHLWYGTVTNFNFDTKKYFTFNVGADVRFYKGDHFQQLVNPLGLQGRDGSNTNRGTGYTVTKTYEANPWTALFNPAKEEDRIGYDNSEQINYQGVFGQAEFKKDGFSAFIQGAASNQSYQKFDRWNYEGGEAKSKVDNKLGYNVKGGAAYTFATIHTLFANVGNYSRQPFLDNVFISNTVDFVDPEVANEKIFGLEAGYKLNLRNFRANLNAYYTKWENRFASYNASNYEGADGTVYDDVTYLLTGITQLHKGIELDFNADLTSKWLLRGYASLGDWQYDGSSPFSVREEETRYIVSEPDTEVDLSGVNVGDAAQASVGLGTKYRILSNLYADVDWNYFANLYGNVDVENVIGSALEGEVYQSEKLKPFSVFDLGATYNFNLGSQKFSFRGNVRNLFNHTYISRKDGFGYFYGLGRTWSASITYNF